jgi:hypothetical protein
MQDTVQRNLCTRQTIAQASRAFCDILAQHVGIVGEAYQGPVIERQRCPNHCRQITGSPTTEPSRKLPLLNAREHEAVMTNAWE